MKWRELNKVWKKESKFCIECKDICVKYHQQHSWIVQTEEIKPVNDGHFSRCKKVQLSERANDIYWQQTKYMIESGHEMEGIIQDKCHIIENLLYRYDCGILPKNETMWAIFFGKMKNGTIQFKSDDESSQYRSNQHLLTKQANTLAKISLLEYFDLKQKVQQLKCNNKIENERKDKNKNKNHNQGEKESEKITYAVDDQMLGFRKNNN